MKHGSVVGLVVAVLVAVKVYDSITPHFFAVPVLLLGYAAFIALRPRKSCGRCGGLGARAGQPCTKCAATGSTFRFGAPFVHYVITLARREFRLWRARRLGGDQ